MGNEVFNIFSSNNIFKESKIFRENGEKKKLGDVTIFRTRGHLTPKLNITFFGNFQFAAKYHKIHTVCSRNGRPDSDWKKKNSWQIAVGVLSIMQISASANLT